MITTKLLVTITTPAHITNIKDVVDDAISLYLGEGFYNGALDVAWTDEQSTKLESDDDDVDWDWELKVEEIEK